MNMNSMHTMFRFFMAVAFAAFALPASAAPEKIYSLKITELDGVTTPASVPAGTTKQLKAIFKNETPTGNSSFNSLTLNVAGGGLVIVGATVPNGVVSPVVSPGSPATTINVINMSPVKNGKSFTVTLTVAASPASGCANSTATWSAVLWTGSSLSGDNFNIVPSLSSLTTTVTAGCSMVFVTQPQNALSGGKIGGPVKVQVSPVGAFAGPITLTVAGASPQNNFASISPTGFAVFPDLIVTGPAGSYTLLATSTGPAGAPTATSMPFTISASDGILDCEGTFSDGANGGQRGKFNKDGSLCVPMAYDFTNNVSTTNSTRLVWDTITQATAAIEVNVTWQPELVAMDGLPAKTTYVAWFVNGVLTDPPVPGRACLSDSLPQPYGTLTGYTPAPDRITIGATGSTIPVPATYPFAIFIGDGTVTERLLVTGPDGLGGYNALRAQGGTSQANLGSVLNTALVMSNPLPLDSSSLQMQMCIADEFWMSLPPGTAGCPANPNGIACIVYRSRVFDIGDGVINRGF